VLELCPDSFWGHYRAAALAFRLHDPAAVTGYLEHCIARRPQNATLRTQLAGCLSDLHQYDAALQQCNEALSLNPDEAQAYATRAYIRCHLIQGVANQSDLKRYELLTRGLGKLPAWRLRLTWMQSARSIPVPAVPHDRDWTEGELAERILYADPEDGDARTALAIALQSDGHTEKALAEYNQVLEINPDDLRARYSRAGLLFDRHRGDADADFSYVVNHPRFGELIRQGTGVLDAFWADSSELLHRGAADQAVRVAERGLVYARELGDRGLQGKLHYALSRAYAMNAKAAPEELQKAAAHLFIASEFDRRCLGSSAFWADGHFSGQHAAIARLIPGIAVPVD
jgi:tetratricopeptide (TPR) repeat protein